MLGHRAGGAPARAYNTRPQVTKIRMPALLRAMRPQQWVKNLFVLAPVVFAHRLGDPALLGRALLALAAFCAGSSAVYLSTTCATARRTATTRSSSSARSPRAR